MKKLLVALALLLGLASYADEDVDNLAKLLDQLPSSLSLNWIKKVDSDGAISISKEGEPVAALAHDVTVKGFKIMSSLEKKGEFKKIIGKNKIDLVRDFNTPIQNFEYLICGNDMARAWMKINSKSPEAINDGQASFEKINAKYASNLNRVKSMIKQIQDELSKTDKKSPKK